MNRTGQANGRTDHGSMLVDGKGLRLNGTVRGPTKEDVGDRVAAELAGVSKEAGTHQPAARFGGWQAIAVESPDGTCSWWRPRRTPLLLTVRILTADGPARPDRRSGRPRSARLAGATHMTAAQALERVTQVPGVRGSLLISGTDGLVVAERLMDGIDGRAVRRAGRQSGPAAGSRYRAGRHAGSQVCPPAGQHRLCACRAWRSDLVLVAVARSPMPIWVSLGFEMLDAVGRLA